MTLGVTRKGTRGVPSCVTQEELNSEESYIEIRVTVKEAVLEGGPGCTNLIGTSIYDTNPVHYISMISK